MDIDKIISKFEKKNLAISDGVLILVIYILGVNVPLAYLINSSLISGIFPINIKLKKIKSPEQKPIRCRQLSSSSIVIRYNKDLQKVIYQLASYLETSNLYDQEQHYLLYLLAVHHMFKS